MSVSPPFPIARLFMLAIRQAEKNANHAA